MNDHHYCLYKEGIHCDHDDDYDSRNQYVDSDDYGDGNMIRL